MSTATTEIGQLEKTLNTLIYRPRLIRRDYWETRIECLLKQAGLTPQEKQRLDALLALISAPV